MDYFSYPKVYHLGHQALVQLFDGPVTVEEKIDGSQFSFGYINNELHCWSHHNELNIDAPEKMFALAIQTVERIKNSLIEDVIYRGEYLRSPHHGTLGYNRVPVGNIILFDIAGGLESYWEYEDVAEEATRLSLEVVPRFRLAACDSENFKALLETESILGGVKIEGFVVKNYRRFDPTGKPLMGKFVSESFKEANKVAWRASNPTQGDIIQAIIATYRNEARWAKAVGHLADQGLLEGAPQDIGKLIKEVPDDILSECKDEIKEALFKHAWPHIRRALTAGLPEWYKGKLLERQFNGEIE